MTDKTREKIAEIILAVRQYLLNTEFAPEPLGEPVDPKKLTEYFPDAILAIPEIKEGQELREKAKSGNGLALNQYAKGIQAWREGKGFDTSWGNMQEKLMLVVTEVAEASEARRKDDWENFKEEIADTFIRLMDITASLDIDIESCITAKMELNENRPHMHGKNA